MATAKAARVPLVLVWGDEDLAVSRRAGQIFQSWREAHPGAEEEIIDASASNTDEVERVLARLREALLTLPFFGNSKSVWFRGCNFAGDERVAQGQAVIDATAGLARDLAAFRWDGVRLLISAGVVDRRRVFYKTLEKAAEVEHFPGLNTSDRDWQDQAESLAAGEFKTLGKRLDHEALAAFIGQVGANARLLASEALKLATYVGDRAEINSADIEAVVTRGKQSRAFALADAFGERNLGRALRHLDEEFWAMQSDKQKSEIGILYALIAKVRAMILAQELTREGLVRPGREYNAFAAQLKKLPADQFASDKRYSPVQINAYVLFRAAQHATNFTREELVEAMSELLRCNRLLVGSSAEGRLVLQFALSRMIGGRSRQPRTATVTTAP